MSDCCRAPKLSPPSRWSTGREGVIDEHNAMSDKTVVPDRNQFANKAVRLNSGSVAYRHILLNLDEWAYEAIVADRATIEICRLYDLDALTEGNISNSRIEQGWTIIDHYELRVCNASEKIEG